MMIGIFLLTVMFGMFWGKCQGMIMIKPEDAGFVAGKEPGVRGSEWFDWYHIEWVLCMTAFALLISTWILGLIYVVSHEFLPVARYILNTIGCAFAGWEAAELMYSRTRYHRWIPKSENMAALMDEYSAVLNGIWVRKAHIIRCAAGFMFIFLA